MADSENYLSMLPQPSRNGGVMRALTELSSSDNNARHVMAPPTGVNHKRQGSNLPEPAAKRKTLVERAGEPIKQFPAAPRSQTGTEPPSTSFSTFRSMSNNTSSSYRSNSGISRHTSSSSFSGSLGTGLRPPQSISHLARPKTALAKDKAQKTADVRPTTSHGLKENPDQKSKKTFPLSLGAARKASTYAALSVISPRRSASSNLQKRKYGVIALPSSARKLSLVSQFQTLSIDSSAHGSDTSNQTDSPSRIPKPSTPGPYITMSSSRGTSPSKSSKVQYLTRWSNIEALDADEHYTNFKRMFEDYQDLYKQTLGEVHQAKNANDLYTSTIEKLEEERTSKTETIITLTSENAALKYRIEAAERAMAEQRAAHEAFLEEFRTAQRTELEQQKQEAKSDLDLLKSDHRDEIGQLKRKHDAEIEDERNQRIQALSQSSAQGALDKQRQQMELDMKDLEIRNAKAESNRIAESLEREKIISNDLRKVIADSESRSNTMESNRQALEAKIDFLTSDNESQSKAYAEMERRMNEAFAEADECRQKLHKEETLRRKLHNQVQELKGNIRVFCRVRPTLPSEEPEELADMNFPESEEANEIEVKGQEEKNSLGKITTRTHPYSFDRVFNPSSNNDEIFDEISQLIQSALDGFNVCIFAYGQTGSGKTYTMSSDDGVIPRALRQIYSTSKELEERGWQYTMEGSFIEVYNEDIRDLLGKDDSSMTNKKHEIRHDMQKCETTITDVVSITLDSQEQVENILTKAMSKRSVAATKANEHSSRSHSVFILKLHGHNTITGEKSKGTLNLVDLAGSERLSHSKVEGQRLKETQSINKSLSCLGDVIGALGQQGTTLSAFDPRASVSGSSSGANAGGQAVASHIPYRNSKLTYLLQFSLGGNSKTLMFVMVAPEKKCLGETLTSLKFADKVSRTRVGVAKKVK